MTDVRTKRVRLLQWQTNGFGSSGSWNTSTESLYSINPVGGIFYDSFTRVDAAVIGSPWTLNGGAFSIVSNALKAGTTYSTARTQDLGAVDMEAQFTITVAGTSASKGVCARSDITMANYYLFRYDGTSWQLFRVNAGVFTAIGSAYTAASPSGDIAKIKVVGTAVEGYVNGVLRCSATDSSVTTGNYAGVRLASDATTVYDDFIARTITFGDTPTSVLGEPALESAGTLIGFSNWTTGGGASRTTLYDRMWISGRLYMGATVAASINSPTLPARDINGTTNGAGCHAYLICPSTGISGTTTISYTNSAGTSGRTGTAAAMAAYGMRPFELQEGDVGVRSIQSVSSTVEQNTAFQIAIFRKLGIFDTDENLLKPVVSTYPISIRLQSGTVLLPGLDGYSGAGRIGYFAAHVALD